MDDSINSSQNSSSNMNDKLNNKPLSESVSLPNENIQYKSQTKSTLPSINVVTSYFIPSLLEEPEVKCGEFENMVDIFIHDLEEEINNIPKNKNPVNTPQHIKNTKNVILSMYSCINCVIDNIHKDEPTDCFKNVDEETTQSIPQVSETTYTLYDS
jgi:hypothetical protein